jgi:hypothetical protein
LVVAAGWFKEVPVVVSVVVPGVVVVPVVPLVSVAEGVVVVALGVVVSGAL